MSEVSLSHLAGASAHARCKVTNVERPRLSNHPPPEVICVSGVTTFRVLPTPDADPSREVQAHDHAELDAPVRAHLV